MRIAPPARQRNDFFAPEVGAAPIPPPEGKNVAMVVVIARYLAHRGSGDEVSRLLREHVRATRAEPGCVQFLVNRSEADPDRFLLYEQYLDEAAFEDHRRSPHFKRLLEGAVVPLLSEREWDRYRLVEPEGAVGVAST